MSFIELFLSVLQLETDHALGTNKGISEKSLGLKIFSPHQLNITMANLPGITKVPVCNQQLDIEAHVHNFIPSYINYKPVLSGQSCLQMLIWPAANSDALQMYCRWIADGLNC
jgi:dynamin 1-like protein